MARVRVDFEIRSNLLEQTRRRLEQALNRRTRGNLSDLRSVVAKAIDRGVADSKELFIPSLDQAGELGVGAKRRVDRERTEGAWKQLNSAGGITTFSVRARRGRGRLANITVTINEEEFYKAPLSNVQTSNGEIPWMRWFIKGETIQGFEFSDNRPVPQGSRTGRGVMVEGGFWRFRPVNSNAFSVLGQNIQRRIENSIRRNAGSVIR